MNADNANHVIRYLGIDLGGTSVKFGRATEGGVVEYQSKSATRSAKGRDALLAQLADIGESMLTETTRLNYKVQYLGIVTPGAVDAEYGRIIGGSPNLPDWVGAEISATVEKKLGIPVLVENDARGMALAEFRFGAGRDISSALCITVGTGIGGAIIIDNQLWRGFSQTAGEIGHSIIDVDNSLTEGGLRGTLENLTSATAIERRMKRMLQENGLTETFKGILKGAPIDDLLARQIFDAYHLDDELAVRCLRETGDILGRSLAGFVNLLNPEMVIIGGGVTDAVPELVTWVADTIQERALISASSDLQVTRATLGNSAGLLGAALLGKERFWRDLLRRKSSAMM